MGSITPYETANGRRYRVRYRTPNRSQTDKRGFRTKREAEIFLAGIEVAKARGEFVDASMSRITVEEWSERWLSTQVQLKPSTRSGYESIIRTRIVPKWGRVSIGDLNHGALQDWISAETKRAKPATVRSYHRVMSLMIKYAIRDGRLTRNVADGIRLPRITKERRGYLNHEQVRELATLCGPDGDIVLLLAYTGLRWGEMAALRVGDIELANLRLNIEQAVTEVGGNLVYGTPKNHSRRSVPFPFFLTAALERRSLGKGRADLVFTAPYGGALSNQNWRRRNFNRAMAELIRRHPTLIPLTPHDLRHTAASLAISIGANVKAVQRMLGHASAAMTLDVYSDLFDDDLDSVGVALSAAATPGSVGKMWANAPATDLANQEQIATATPKPSKHMGSSGDTYGGPRRARTDDQRIKSPMLYQLS
jgi:integrase